MLDRRAATLPVSFVAAALLAACGGGDGDYGDRMSREHEADRPQAAAARIEHQAGAPAAVEIVAERVEYATVAGAPVIGYLARPADAPDALPGLLVIHEWWGLNDNVETMARMLARPGYAVLAVDLYGGRTAATPEQARELMKQAMAAPERAEDNLRQAYSYLSETVGSPRVGVLGWCFGGGWALNAALLLPDRLDAAVVYYGRLVTDRERLATLEMPILGIFGGEDQGIPVEQVREFEATLAALGKDARIVVYEGAGHAFANPSGTRYEPAAAQDAWEKTLAFLAEHLVPAG